MTGDFILADFLAKRKSGCWFKQPPAMFPSWTALPQNGVFWPGAAA